MSVTERLMMSFYGIGISGCVESARRTARFWGVRLYGVEAMDSVDANGDARLVGARASLRYGKKLDRWYKHSGVHIKEIVPPARRSRPLRVCAVAVSLS